MSASVNLTTLSEVKRYLAIDLTDLAQDELLQSIIAAVSEAVENYCRRQFARQTRVEFHDGTCTNSIVLRCRPVWSVTSLHDDLDRRFNDLSFLSPENYVLYEEEGILRLRYGLFAPGLRNVRVEYNAGYDALPASLTQAANILTAHFYTRARSGADAIASESVGVYSVSYDTGEWPSRATGLLAEFREVQL